MIQKDKLFISSYSFRRYKVSANIQNTAYVPGDDLDATPIPGEPDIMWQSVVYIGDMQAIWTAGTLFLGGKKFADGSKSFVSVGGLSMGTDIGGKSVFDVLDMMISPELAPFWQDAVVVWDNRSSFDGRIYEVGEKALSDSDILSHLSSLPAAAIGGDNIAYGGLASRIVATGSIFGTEFTGVGTYTVGYSVTFDAGTDQVRTNKGTLTNKVAFNETTPLADATITNRVDATTFAIKSIKKTDAINIYSTYAVYANTSSITRMTKQPLSAEDVLTISFPPENLTDKHSFSVPSSYSVTGIQILNTLSGRFEDYDINLFARNTDTRRLPNGTIKQYTLYRRNHGTNGANTFRISFNRQ